MTKTSLTRVIKIWTPEGQSGGNHILTLDTVTVGGGRGEWQAYSETVWRDICKRLNIHTW